MPSLYCKNANLQVLALNVIASVILLFSLNLQAAPKSEALPFWNGSNKDNSATVDHSLWQQTLDQYLDSNHKSGINRFNYAAVDQGGRETLHLYLQSLKNLDPRNYSMPVQKAYWINLYNALTVELILENYPIKSITKLGKGFFSFGPWDDKIVTVVGEKLSLNDIEHGILRPYWRDPRIHYAVNCASLSCPNLAPQTYTAANTEVELEAAASSYINHTRGVHFNQGNLLLSSIYQWYLDDFGGNSHELIKHLHHYAKTALKQQLRNFKGDIEYDYDWALNQAEN